MMGLNDNDDENENDHKDISVNDVEMVAKQRDDDDNSNNNDGSKETDSNPCKEESTSSRVSLTTTTTERTHQHESGMGDPSFIFRSNAEEAADDDTKVVAVHIENQDKHPMSLKSRSTKDPLVLQTVDEVNDHPRHSTGSVTLNMVEEDNDVYSVEKTQGQQRQQQAPLPPPTSADATSTTSSRRREAFNQRKNRRQSTLEDAMSHPINSNILLRSIEEIAQYAYCVSSVEVWFFLKDQGDVLVQPPGGYWRNPNSHSITTTTVEAGDCHDEDEGSSSKTKIQQEQLDALRHLEQPDELDYVGPTRLRPGEGIPGALWWMSSSSGARGDDNLLRNLVVKYKGRKSPNTPTASGDGATAMGSHRRVLSRSSGGGNNNSTSGSMKYFTSLFGKNNNNGTGRSGKFFAHLAPSSPLKTASSPSPKSAAHHRRGYSEDYFNVGRHRRTNSGTTGAKKIINNNETATRGGQHFMSFDNDPKQDDKESTTRSAKFFAAIFGKSPVGITTDHDDADLSNRSGTRFFFSTGSSKRNLNSSTKSGQMFSPSDGKDDDFHPNHNGEKISQGPPITKTPNSTHNSSKPRHRRVRTTGDVTFLDSTTTSSPSFAGTSSSNRPVTAPSDNKLSSPSATMTSQRQLKTIQSKDDDFDDDNNISITSPLEMEDDDISELQHSTTTNSQRNVLMMPSSALRRGKWTQRDDDDEPNDDDDGTNIDHEDDEYDDDAATMWTSATPSPSDIHGISKRDVRKVIWHDIREFVLDPLQPTNQRMMLLYQAGYTHVSGVTFHIRGQQGIVIYYSIKPNLMELQRSVHNAYLLSAADLMGAQASLMITRTEVAEYQQAQQKEEEELRRQKEDGKRPLEEEDATAVEAGIVKKQDDGVDAGGIDGTNTATTTTAQRMKLVAYCGCHQQLTNWKQKCFGINLTPPPCMPNYQVAFTGLSIFVTMLLVSSFAHAGTYFFTSNSNGSKNLFYQLPLGPMGAILSLTFGLPAAPLGQPRNIVFGHLLSIPIGIVINFILPASTVGYGLSVLRTSLVASLSVSTMVKCGVLHPPATALAIIFSESNILGLNLLFSFMAVLLADLCIISCSVAINNVSSKRQYPLFWSIIPTSFISCMNKLFEGRNGRKDDLTNKPTNKIV